MLVDARSRSPSRPYVDMINIGDVCGSCATPRSAARFVLSVLFLHSRAGRMFEDLKVLKFQARARREGHRLYCYSIS